MLKVELAVPTNRAAILMDQFQAETGSNALFIRTEQTIQGYLDRIRGNELLDFQIDWIRSLEIETVEDWNRTIKSVAVGTGCLWIDDEFQSMQKTPTKAADGEVTKPKNDTEAVSNLKWLSRHAHELTSLSVIKFQKQMTANSPSEIRDLIEALGKVISDGGSWNVNEVRLAWNVPKAQNSTHLSDLEEAIVSTVELVEIFDESKPSTEFDRKIWSCQDAMFFLCSLYKSDRFFDFDDEAGEAIRPGTDEEPLFTQQEISQIGVRLDECKKYLDLFAVTEAIKSWGDAIQFHDDSQDSDDNRDGSYFSMPDPC